MLTYQQAIKACGKELDKMKPSELESLYKHNRVDNITDLSTVLIDQNYPVRVGSMESGDLPYDGNIQEAMRKGDRQAIREIIAYRDSREAERNRELARKDSELQISDSAKNCSNEIDLISAERWSETFEPTLKIRYLDYANPFTGPSQVFCYRIEDLLMSLKDPNTLQAIWIQNKLGTYSVKPDDDGYNTAAGGFGPSIQTVNKLPDSHFVIVSDTLLSDNRYNISKGMNLVAIPIGKVRLGNIYGTYGVSRLHGQAPDKIIYLLTRDDEDLVKDTLEEFLGENLKDRLFVGGISLIPNSSEKYANFIANIVPEGLSLSDLQPLFDEPITNVQDGIRELISEIWFIIISKGSEAPMGYKMDRMVEIYENIVREIGYTRLKDLWHSNVIDKYLVEKDFDSINLIEQLREMYDTVPYTDADYDDHTALGRRIQHHGHDPEQDVVMEDINEMPTSTAGRLLDFDEA